MLLNKNTTILALRKTNLISVRTYNCLYSAKMKTIGDILNRISIPFDLMKLPKFGRKSLMEVEDILSMMRKNTVIIMKSTETESQSDVEKEHINKIEHAYKEIVQGTTRVNAYLRDNYPEPSTLNQLVINRKDDMMKIVEGFSRKENIELRRAYLRFMNLVLMDVGDEIIENDPFYAQYKIKADKLSRKIESFSYGQIAKYFISPIAQAYLEKMYHEKLRSKASIRARHLADAYLPHFYDIIKYAEEPFGKYQNICKGRTMMVTLEEIFKFNQEFKKDFERIIALSDEEIKELTIKEDYQFLSDAQQQFVIEFARKYQHKPLLFILLTYLRTSEKRSNKIFSLLHGIYDGKPLKTIDIAERMGLTRERVRQILSEDIEAQHSQIVKDEDWKWYNELFDIPFIGEKNKEYAILIRMEQLQVDFNAFAALIRLVADFFFESVRANKILINNKLNMKNTHVVLKELDKKIKEKRSNEMFLSLDDLVIHVNIDHKNETKQLLEYVLTYIYKVEISEDGILHLKQNYIDVAEELYNILEKKGKPTHVNEIYKEFMTKYPDYKYTNPLQIKPFLQKHQHIRAIGKTSCYALDYWEGVYFGSIRDLLMDLLVKSKKPLHIDVLFKKVKRHYPNTTKSSLSSTMKDEQFNRFVAFEGGFFGISSRSYDKEFVELPSRQRFSFEERLKMLNEFVNENHRLPNFKFNTKESTLARWLNNVKSGGIKSTEQQKNALDRIINKFK